MADSDTTSSPLDRVWDAIKTVPDPEIPDLSVVDLGMIAGVTAAGESVNVRMTPTFAACPALAHIQEAIGDAVRRAGFAQVEVEIVFDPPWTTDRITPLGREKLKLFGLAPPPMLNGREVQPEDLEGVACPYCDSTRTTLESSFGPTLCRSIHYCNQCLQSFEHFKPLS